MNLDFLKNIYEVPLASLDGYYQGLFGIDLIKDDSKLMSEKAAKLANKITNRLAPATVGAAVGVATGNPQAGMAVYSAANELGTKTQTNLNSNKKVVNNDPYAVEYGDNYMIAENGGVTDPYVQYYNIERGELLVDPKSGDVVQNFDSPQYKSHSKNKKNEHTGNFVPIQEDGLVIIPKKMSNSYLKNKNLREGIIRKIQGESLERSVYGIDHNGNMQEFNKLVPMAESGIVTQGGGNVLQTYGGDIAGYTGMLVGGLGPLLTTMKNGIDKNETNTFIGHENRAANKLSNILNKGRESVLATLRNNGRAAINTIRRGSVGFNNMTSRVQSSMNDINTQMANAALQYDLQNAQSLADLYYKGALTTAEAEDRRLEKLDMNRDNYQTNIANNLANLGATMTATGAQLNNNRLNRDYRTILSEGSENFYIDPITGRIVFKKQDEKEG